MIRKGCSPRKTILAVAMAGVFASALLGGKTATAEELKVGYVDVQRALMETSEGQSAKKKLKTMFEAKQKELDERQEELKKLKTDLDKQRSLLKPDVVSQRERDLQQKFLQLQETYVRLQKELSEKEATMMKPILEKMNGVIGKLAQTDNFSIILEKSQSSILWARPHLDLTNEVIRQYNAGGQTPAQKRSK